MHNHRCESCGSAYASRHVKSRFCSRPCQWSKNGGQNRQTETWWTSAKGYIEGRVWVDGRQVAVKQHRWLMEKHLGRKLLPTEDVHHRDGNRSNNAIDNLEVVSHGSHSRLTNSGRTYRSGYTLDLTEAERRTRAEQAKSRRLWEHGHNGLRRKAAITKATGGAA